MEMFAPLPVSGTDGSGYEVAMKKKVETVLEKSVLKRAKLRAAEQGRPLSDVIQDALERYLAEGVPELARREAAYQLFCERPMRLQPEQLKAVLEHNNWVSIA